jgi:parvulin-like peptidyl-prolyl isomerase
VQESPEFSMANPPAELGASQEIAATVFEKLSKEQPNSEVLTADNGYYVVQLSGVTPARPLSFEEAKDKLTAQLKDERAHEALNLKAAEIRTKLESALKAGKSFAEAAAAAGVKSETLPAFSMMEPPKDNQPDTRMLMGQSFELATGELSTPVPTETGVLLLHVDKRTPGDESKFEQEKPMLTQGLARNKREAAFNLWLKERRAQAKVVVGRG